MFWATVRLTLNGDDNMATRSILENVNFRDKSLTKGFVSALENAAKKKSKEVALQKMCTDVKRDQIKDFFGKK